MKGWGIEAGMSAKQTNMENNVYGSLRNIYTRQLAQVTSRENFCAMYTVPALNWEYGMVLVIACLKPSAARKMQLAAPCALGRGQLNLLKGSLRGGPFHEQKT